MRLDNFDSPRVASTAIVPVTIPDLQKYRRLERLPLDHVVLPSTYLRRDQDNAPHVSEIAMSIQAVGLLSPILVRPHDGATDRFEVVSGGLRYLAHIQLGRDLIDVLVVDTANPMLVTLIDNMQRHDLAPVEFALGLKQLKEAERFTDEQLARILGKSRTLVSQTLKIASLPDTILNEAKALGAMVGRDTLAIVARLERGEAQDAAWSTVKKKASLGKGTRQAAREVSANGKVRTKPRHRRSTTSMFTTAQRSADKLHQALAAIPIDDATADFIDMIDDLIEILGDAATRLAALKRSANQVIVDVDVLDELPKVVTVAGHPERQPGSNRAEAP